MMNQKVTIVTVLLACLAASSGCQAPTKKANTVSPASKAENKSIVTSASRDSARPAFYASLTEIGRFTIKHADYDIGQLAVSPSGRFVAVKASGASDWIEIHSIPSGKLVAVFRSDLFGLHNFSWHPQEDLLAFAGGRAAEPERPGITSSGVYYVLNGRNGKVVTKIPVESELSDPVVWTPDGKNLISTKGSWVGGDLVDMASKQVKPSGLGNDTSLHLSMSPKWVIASEHSRIYDEPSSIVLYKADPGNPETFTESNSLAATGDSFRTQPTFLQDGKLTFVKVLLNRDGSRRGVELWTSESSGKNEHAWVKLPMLSEGVDGKFSVVPVSWSSDGHVLVYAQGTTVIVNSISTK